jgi:hypothetical protein
MFQNGIVSRVVGVLVSVRMPMAMTMTMPMMRVSKHREPNKVDNQPQHADDEQLVEMAKFRTIAETVECFE